MDSNRTIDLRGTASFPRQMRSYAETSVMVAASTLLGFFIEPKWGNSPVDLLYLLPVLGAASLYGLRPALFAAVASTLAFNFFFTEPVHTFRISQPGDLLTAAMLFVVAVVTSQLAARMRMQARIAAANAARNATIAGFARRLLSCSTRAEIGRVTCEEITALFDCNAVLVDGDGGSIEVIAAQPPESPITPSDIAAAVLVLAGGEPAGRGSPRLSPAEWLFYPVGSKDRVISALGVARDDGARAIPDEHLPLLENLIDQSALALEREQLEAQARDVAELRDRDRLRQALLSSVGHDLRTPLTAIVAAAEELRQRLPDRGDPLTGTIATEARRLERYVTNLLDMARIEADSIRLKAEPIDLVDAATAATHDLKGALAGHRLAIEIPADLPLVKADPQLLHHMLINLLDNAGRYSPPGSTIAIGARRTGDGLDLSVLDEGPGLPAGTGGGPFARFREASGSDRRGGAGLGLAIVGGFAEAMGLKVSADNRADGQGASFTLHFPVANLIDGQKDESPDEQRDQSER